MQSWRTFLRLRDWVSCRWCLGMFVLIIPGLFCSAAVAKTAATTRKAPVSRAQVYRDPAGYAVYSALLPHLWPLEQLDAQHPVIVEKTKSHVSCGAPTGTDSGNQQIADDGASNGGSSANTPAKGDVAAAIKDFNQVNQKPWLLQRKFQISRSYSLIGTRELAAISHHVIGAWDLFFERHADSGGWIQLSAVGFSPDKKTAALYAAYACGQQCGGEALYVLHLNGAKWQLAKSPAHSCSGAKDYHQMTGF